MEGLLEKTATGPFKNKSKVWMILEGNTLTYYNPNRRSSPVGSIELASTKSVALTSAKGQNQFEVVTDTKTFTFTAESSEECKQWIDILHKSVGTMSNVSKNPVNGEAGNRMSDALYASIEDDRKTVPKGRVRAIASGIYADLSDDGTSQNSTSVFRSSSLKSPKLPKPVSDAPPIPKNHPLSPKKVLSPTGQQRNSEFQNKWTSVKKEPEITSVENESVEKDESMPVVEEIYEGIEEPEAEYCTIDEMVAPECAGGIEERHSYGPQANTKLETTHNTCVNESALKERLDQNEDCDSKEVFRSQLKSDKKNSTINDCDTQAENVYDDALSVATAAVQMRKPELKHDEIEIEGQTVQLRRSGRGNSHGLSLQRSQQDDQVYDDGISARGAVNKVQTNNVDSKVTKTALPARVMEIKNSVDQQNQFNKSGKSEFADASMDKEVTLRKSSTSRSRGASLQKSIEYEADDVYEDGYSVQSSQSFASESTGNPKLVEISGVAVGSLEELSQLKNTESSASLASLKSVDTEDEDVCEDIWSVNEPDDIIPESHPLPSPADVKAFNKLKDYLNNNAVSVLYERKTSAQSKDAIEDLRNFLRNV